MILRSSVKGTVGHVVDRILSGRDSNLVPGRSQVSSIHINNNVNQDKDNLNNIVYDSTDLSATHDIFPCVSKRCKSKNKFVSTIVTLCNT